MSNGDNRDNLWISITSLEALQDAWGKVFSNRGTYGGDNISLKQFSSDIFANLTEIRAELLGGIYKTGPFRQISIPKKKPGYRVLTVPTIRDRVVHTSITNALTPIFEPLFEDGSFAYRPGRGVVDAVKMIEKWRDAGYSVVIEADIVSYFDNIDQSILISKIEGVIKSHNGSAAVLSLIETILADQAKALGAPKRGIAQGSPLSPLLANLYLDALDEEIEKQGVKIVRFADDFVILCKSKKKAEKALDHCVKVLDQHCLKLHNDGTKIVNFDKGFDFIGYLFVRTLALRDTTGQVDEKLKPPKPVKSIVTDEGVIEIETKGSTFDPGRRVLYILDDNHALETRNRSFSIIRRDEVELIAIPYHRVGRIEIGPNVDFSRKALELAWKADIEVICLDHFGQSKGLITSTSTKKANLQFKQAESILNNEFRMHITSKLVNSRIKNQRTQLFRLNRTRDNIEVKVVLKRMKASYRKIDIQNSVNELRGVEGSATALYWPALSLMLNVNQQNGVFRRTRPARDPFNAVINYCTAILERDIRASIQSTGLHTGFAFLHSSRDRHDGLVYDLMEPFRASLTEGLAVYLFNSKRVKSDMFSKRLDGTINISPDARKAVVSGYESMVAKRVNKPDKKEKLTWRAIMIYQARTLANAILDNNTLLFQPYLMEA
jgi:CRISPR-associated protein Cas1